MKLISNLEIFNEYIIVRDQLDKHMKIFKEKIDLFPYHVLLGFEFDTLNVYSSLNLVYFDNRICTLHDENPTDRMIKQANSILLEILPDFFKTYEKHITSLTKK